MDFIKRHRSSTAKKEAREEMEKKKIEAENARQIMRAKAIKELEENAKKKEAEREKAIQPRSRDYVGEFWHHNTDEDRWEKEIEYGHDRESQYRSGRWFCQNDYCQTPEVAHNASTMEQTWSDMHGKWVWICMACIPMFTCVPGDSGVDICVPEDGDVDML